MKRRSIYVFVSTALAMLVPSPGRFVYGLALVLQLNLVMLIGILINSLTKTLKLEEESSVILLGSTVFTTILFRQIMVLINPEVVLTLGFVIYLMPISFFFLGYLFSDVEDPLGKRLKFTFSHILTFSVYALLYFLIRDVFGYGTITYFGSGFNIVEKVLLDPEKVSIFSLLASIPGSLLFSAVVLFIHIVVRNKSNIIKNVEACE
ncbi:MAG: hypothetical protein MJ179_00305 [Treponema sp.]|nr:hypothetical protein [Treponema sp.]